VAQGIGASSSLRCHSEDVVDSPARSRCHLHPPSDWIRPLTRQHLLPAYLVSRRAVHAGRREWLLAERSPGWAKDSRRTASCSEFRSPDQHSIVSSVCAALIRYPPGGRARLLSPPQRGSSEDYDVPPMCVDRWSAAWTATQDARSSTPAPDQKQYRRPGKLSS